jgi:hypothetical protein
METQITDKPFWQVPESVAVPTMGPGASGELDPRTVRIALGVIGAEVARRAGLNEADRTAEDAAAAASFEAFSARVAEHALATRAEQ